MARPPNTWRVCGAPIDPTVAGAGCTCGPNDPTRYRATRALARLAEEAHDGALAGQPAVPDLP